MSGIAAMIRFDTLGGRQMPTTVGLGEDCVVIELS